MYDSQLFIKEYDRMTTEDVKASGINVTAQPTDQSWLRLDPVMSSETLPVEPLSEKPTKGSQTTSEGAASRNEKHANYSHIVRDVIIGFADGLTVPFALTAGLSSLGSSKLVIIGGLAELFAGAISMGLGAYLAAVTERDHYLAEEKREREEVRVRPEDEREEVFEILDGYGIGREASRSVVDSLCHNHENWIRFMMDFELKLEKPTLSRAWISAATMGLAYFIGGLLPMIPYFVIDSVTSALFVSIGITFVVLLIFGYVKNYVTIRTKRAGLYGALQTLFIGALAAGVSYGIVRALDQHSFQT